MPEPSRPLAAVTRRAWFAGVLAAPLVLTACGGGDPSGSASSQGSDGSFTPVTITHALGEARIEKKPARIVTLGQGSTETCIALGTIPVGMESYPWGSDDTGYLPWVHEAVEKKGGKLPEQFTGSTELDVEAIVKLAPDLILAPWSGITQDQYDQLKDLAPTVAYPKEAWVITWEEQITTIGKALGRSSDAEGLIADIKDQFAKAKNDDWAQHTFSFIYNSGPGTLGVFFPEEQRVEMVRAFGLTVDPVVDTLKEFEVKGTDSAMIGLENASKLNDSALLFTFYSDEQNRTETLAQPLYAAIPAIQRGSVVAPTDQPFVTGSSMINPLTVPWSIERYRPMIQEAVGKVPAT